MYIVILKSIQNDDCINETAHISTSAKKKLYGVNSIKRMINQTWLINNLIKL